MGGLIIISAMLGNLVIPVVAAQERTLRRGLQKMLLMMFALNILYAIFVRYAFVFF
jgi:hypothetical protein